MFTSENNTAPIVDNGRATASGRQLKRRLDGMKRLFTQNTYEFFKNTTLHGLKYLVNQDLYPIERLFFALAFISVVFVSGIFVAKVYVKWSTTPVIFGFNPEPTFITKEPFPAITICNLNQADKSKAAQYSIYSTEYAMLQLLCKREVNVSVATSITDWSNLNEFITNISQPCTSMLRTCHFGGSEFNCTELFSPIVTDQGLCCVFNMIHPSFLFSSDLFFDPNATNTRTAVPVEWNAEMGYQDNLPKVYYPRPATGTGETLGLSVTLDVEADNYYCSSSNSIGFKILLHNPTEMPSLREIGLLLGAGRETKMRIHTDKTESERKLRSINRRQRQCLFQDEEKLIAFSHYTQRNCEIECVAAMLMKYCGCVSHFMPVRSRNQTICSIYEATCVENVRLRTMLSYADGGNCHETCLPSCYDVTFMPDFFSTVLSNYGFHIVNKVVQNLSSEYVSRNIAIMHVYFKENSYRSNKQTEFIGMTDFMSSIGGLLGLFFGFSFISLAELVFFAVIRPCRVACHRKRRIAIGNHHRSVLLPSNKWLNQRLRLSKTVRNRSRISLGQLKSSSELSNQKIDVHFLNEQILQGDAEEGSEKENAMNSWFQKSEFEYIH